MMAGAGSVERVAATPTVQDAVPVKKLDTAPKPTRHTGPPQIVSLGSAYGGWKFDERQLTKDSVIYSVGLGEDISWDTALVDKYGCDVWGFDPTPKAIRHVEHVAPGQHYHFTAEGLHTRGPESMVFTMPKNPKWVSMRAGQHAGMGDKVSVTVNTLENWMRANGHTSLEILKIDIEGAEYAVLESWLKQPGALPFRQLLVEFHLRMYTKDADSHWLAKDVVEAATKRHNGIIAQLQARGFRIMDRDENDQDISFLRT